ncbi:MAG TPA: hypothetical protein PKY59_22920 [Pyrinomonadaceae bacterium]|nr:hypothetical protein [Pyrinomonadaceae bacterium]
MKPIICVFLLTAIFTVSAFAQKAKPKTAALPAGITKWKGEDSDKILQNAAIKTRLKNLLGKRNYADFMESFETLTPIEKNGNILFASGCLIHACGHVESAVAIDLTKNTIHAAIFREDEKTKYFNENDGKTPKSIKVWANRLATK